MMKVSFQARFTKSRLVSHFMPIPVKYEMSACFKAVPPMKSTDRTMKRDGHKTGAVVSRKTRLVSAPFHVSFHTGCPLIL
jgi:hypothetical protein